jgi:tetratricopeptide (TPR) repeat protein
MHLQRLSHSAVLGLSISLALAQTAWAASDDAKVRAARKACLSGSYQNGVELLTDLFISTNNPVYIYNQARCYEQNGRYEESINSFREYLRKGNPTAEERAETEQHIADCQALLGQKPNLAPVLETKPEVAATARPPYAPVREAEAGGKVETAGQQPIASNVLAGSNTSGQVAAGSTPTPSHSGRGLRIAGLISAVVGVGATATGVYFYTRAKSYSDKVSNEPVRNPSDESAGKNAETMQWVFYGLGGVALATGTVLYVLGWPGADNPGATAGIAPLVAPGLAGISAQGVF